MKSNGGQKFCSTLQVSSNTSAEYIVGIAKQPRNAETPDKEIRDPNQLFQSQ
jgi:hypothetical protein